MVHEQYSMLLLDAEASLDAIPDLLPRDVDVRQKAFAAIQSVLSARGEIGNEVGARLGRIAKLFDIDAKSLALPAGVVRRLERRQAPRPQSIN